LSFLASHLTPKNLSDKYVGIVALFVALLLLNVPVLSSGCGRPDTGYGIPVDISSAKPWPDYPRIRQTSSHGQQIVLTVVSDGSGGFYVGGEFNRVGNFERNNLAHILADGRVDKSWNPNPNDAVWALAASGKNLYAAGRFTRIGGKARSHIACLELSGTPTEFKPEVDSEVWSLEADAGKLYIGGAFSVVNGQDRYHVA
jgi:hypothetical protein